MLQFSNCFTYFCFVIYHIVLVNKDYQWHCCELLFFDWLSDWVKAHRPTY